MFDRRLLLIGAASLLLPMVPHVCSSSGDRDPLFAECMMPCYRKCRTEPDHRAYTAYPQQWLPLTCHEQCNYMCIDRITATRQQQALPMLKYHGHWPFIRYFGMEEPASVVFSLLNLAPHINYLIQRMRTDLFGRPLVSKSAEMASWLPLYALVGCNCWIASAVYHSKKTQWATHYDLISALSILTFELFMCLRRTLWGNICILCNEKETFGSESEGDPPSKRSWWSCSSIYLLFGAAVSCCSLRAYCMLQGLVSFSSHMHLCIGIVAASTAVWIIWVMGDYFLTQAAASKQRLWNSKWQCLWCQFGMIIASALEIFDFPPVWGIFDAHSLWHLATVPLGFMWYDFWEADNKRAAAVTTDELKSQ